MKILDKQDFYEKWQRGALGNRIRSWTCLGAVIADGFNGLLGMRVKRPVGGSGKAAFGVTVEQAKEIQQSWIDEGILVSQINYNEASPDDCLIVQGEIASTTEHLEFRYSTARTNMRAGMQSANHMKGVMVTAYLRAVMTTASYEQLHQLLDHYPDSVIEFSVYEHCLGVQPGHNWIVWEVRNY